MSHNQHGLGWMRILSEVERRLAVHAPGARVAGSTEKCGLLRLYIAGHGRLDDTQAMHNIYTWALEQSQCTCELCGHDGVLRVWSWRPQTLCDACDDAVAAVNGGGVPRGYRRLAKPRALAAALPALDPGRVQLTRAWRAERQLRAFGAPRDAVASAFRDALDAAASAYDALLLSWCWKDEFTSALAYSTLAERQRFCRRVGTPREARLMVQAYSLRLKLVRWLPELGR
jgi:hypothetical protein